MVKLAVIRTGGKQYLVKEGDVLKVEKLDATESVAFADVLMVGDSDGSRVEFGGSKAKVNAHVVKQGRAAKIRVVHYKAKIRHHKVYGHRQPFTEVKVDKIS